MQNTMEHWGMMVPVRRICVMYCIHQVRQVCYYIDGYMYDFTIMCRFLGLPKGVQVW